MSADAATLIDHIKSFLEAMGRKEFDKAPSFVSSDCEYTNIPMGTVQGPEGVKEVLEPFFAPTLENEFVYKHIAVNGDVVFIERLDRHHLPDGWVELPVTGVFKVENGRITMWRDYFDLPTIMNKWPQPE